MGKVYDGIMGLVVGDALGVPFEFRKRDTFKATGMTGYGTYNQPVGTWSDDSSMTLATLESLVRNNCCISTADIMNRFELWLLHGLYTPYGEVFDVGATTHSAIRRHIRSPYIPPEMCGGVGEMDNGNGSLMRILPLAFVNCGMSVVVDVSALTHGHYISRVACGIYCNIAQHLIKGETKHEAVTNAPYYTLPAEFSRLSRIGELSRDEIKSTGYVMDTLEAALWCFLTTESYKDCVLTAVNLGEDTDTIAAIAGGLAGIYYGTGGEKGIPEDWIEVIAQKEWIKLMCDDLEYQISKE
jgi:ADP-ribosylglycohydrolase